MILQSGLGQLGSSPGLATGQADRFAGGWLSWDAGMTSVFLHWCQGHGLSMWSLHPGTQASYVVAQASPKHKLSS